MTCELRIDASCMSLQASAANFAGVGEWGLGKFGDVHAAHWFILKSCTQGLNVFFEGQSSYQADPSLSSPNPT